MYQIPVHLNEVRCVTYVGSKGMLVFE